MVILEVGLGGRLDATNIVDADVAVVTSIALDHTDWLGPDRESIGREKAGIFRAGKPAVVGEPDMPHTIAEVASEKGALLQRRGVDWRYEVEGETWSFRDAAGVAACLCLRCRCRTPRRPWRRCAPADLPWMTLSCARGSATRCSRRFQIISDAPRVILDVAHNPHAAAYLAGRLKTLEKTGRVLAVIGMLHDKDIAGTLANLAPEVDAWYCAPLEGPRGATAEQLVEHLRGGTVYSSVAQAWRAAMADAKVEDTVLVCGSFHTVAQVMEEIDAGRIGGE